MPELPPAVAAQRWESLKKVGFDVGDFQSVFAERIPQPDAVPERLHCEQESELLAILERILKLSGLKGFRKQFWKAIIVHYFESAYQFMG